MSPEVGTHPARRARSALDLAIRWCLRHPRGAAKRIRWAIEFASAEADMFGRICPAKEGRTTEQSQELIERFEYRAIRALRGELP